MGFLCQQGILTLNQIQISNSNFELTSNCKIRIYNLQPNLIEATAPPYSNAKIAVSVSPGAKEAVEVLRNGTFNPFPHGGPGQPFYMDLCHLCRWHRFEQSMQIFQAWKGYCMWQEHHLFCTFPNQTPLPPIHPFPSQWFTNPGQWAMKHLSLLPFNHHYKYCSLHCIALTPKLKNWIGLCPQKVKARQENLKLNGCLLVKS